MLYTAYLAGWDAKKASYSTGRMINRAIGEYRDSTEEVIDMWLQGWAAYGRHDAEMGSRRVG